MSVSGAKQALKCRCRFPSRPPPATGGWGREVSVKQKATWAVPRFRANAGRVGPHRRWEGVGIPSPASPCFLLFLLGGVPGTRRGVAKKRVAARVPGAAAAPRPWCFCLFVHPSVCPAMAALAPTARILLLFLLLLLPPPGGEPLGVGEFVPARDGASHVCSGPEPSPGITIPTVPPPWHSHP